MAATTSSSAKLTFSTNLVFFDTVFVTQGSSVRIFTVHNNNSEAVVVSSIRVAGTSASFFNINVDGTPGPVVNNVKIPAKDSIYIFATVTVNPNNQNNPLVIQDSLVFTTNGNIQSVKLQAFGLNAYFFVPNKFPKYGPAYHLLSSSGDSNVWTTNSAGKPYVVFGYLLVPPGMTLNIQSGVNVYLHDSAVILVDSGATLQVAGTSAKPVNFQGDRLEPAYKTIPGQWNGILLGPGSINNTISWAVLQNGITGIQADTVYNNNPTLKIDHTIVKSMSYYGLLGEGATIVADDCVFADCQYSSVALYIGGNYQFYQCTFADYWGVDNSYGQRSTPLLYLNNYYKSATNQTIERAIKASFGNCIIYGALNEEIKFDSLYTTGDPMNYYFENCLIKTQSSFPANHCNDSIYKNQDPLFTNPSIDDYNVANPGPAIGRGNATISTTYTIDLDGTQRPQQQATLGAYER